MGFQPSRNNSMSLRKQAAENSPAPDKRAELVSFLGERLGHQVSTSIAASSNLIFQLSHCLLSVLAVHSTLRALARSGTITRALKSATIPGIVMTARSS